MQNSKRESTADGVKCPFRWFKEVFQPTMYNAPPGKPHPAPLGEAHSLVQSWKDSMEAVGMNCIARPGRCSSSCFSPLLAKAMAQRLADVLGNLPEFRPARRAKVTTRC